MSQYPPIQPTTTIYVRPHRGTTILVLGILSLVMSCWVLGLIAWIMGNNDLREIRAGRMDREGEGMTQAGRICGMISTIIAMAALALTCLWFVFVFVIMGAAAGTAAAGG